MEQRAIRPVLEGPQYDNLSLGYRTADEWFAQWEKDRLAGNSIGLMGLLHYGLSMPLLADSRMVLFYLHLADGYDEISEGDHSVCYTVLGDATLGRVKKMLAQKAWAELNRKFFVMLGDSFSSKSYENYRLVAKLLFDPRIMDAVIRFFTLASNSVLDVNNLRSPEKFPAAYVFMKRFVLLAFYPRESGDIFNPGIYLDRPSQSARECAQAALDQMLSRQLAILGVVASHDLFSLLEGKILSSAVNAELRKLALTPEYDGLGVPRDLGIAYLNEGERLHGDDKKFELGVSRYPGAARLLILNQELESARKKVHDRDEVLSKLRQEKAAKEQAAKVRADFAQAKARLDKLQSGPS